MCGPAVQGLLYLHITQGCVNPWSIIRNLLTKINRLHSPSQEEHSQLTRDSDHTDTLMLEPAFVTSMQKVMSIEM